jgi:hypothetical protein
MDFHAGCLMAAKCLPDGKCRKGIVSVKLKCARLSKWLILPFFEEIAEKYGYRSAKGK